MNPASVAKRGIRAAVRRSLAIGPVRRLVEGELARSAKQPRAAAPAGETRTFTDRHGTSHQLDPTHRDRLKPNWRVMCDADQAATPPTDEVLRGRVRKAVKSVTEVERILALTAGTEIRGRILEFGCYDGSAAFELSKRPGTEVVASDLARYYVTQRPGQVAEAALAAEEVALNSLRDRARVVAGRPEGSVSFVEDDITNSSLESESFDLIVSFEVLEHVADPPGTFAAMARLLRPGGVAYHDYNPFFSIIGGHSLATLDLPWGHARLDAEDVDHYLREIRPTEHDQALRFYRDSLNRMTRADLHDAIDGAGLESLAILPWNQRSLLADASPAVLDEVRRIYPSATIDDLLGTFVAVVVRRPAAG